MKFRYIVTCTLLLFIIGKVQSQHIPAVFVKTDVQLGTGDTAPFWFMTNQHGLAATAANSAYLRAGAIREWDTKKRFDYAYGVDLVGAYNLDADFIVQQLYVDLKYRSLFISLGAKERNGIFRNPVLSTGGTLWSGNARPIPQARFGFYDWVKPFRADWFRLKGDFSYGWFTDGCFQRDFINK
ncbi:MAG: capsule assembly Wzi family protein, partial [Bacteroidales bacterium]